MRLYIFVFVVLILLIGITSAEEIKIGVLVDRSGPLATYGNDIKNALDIAKEDINTYFSERGLNFTVDFIVEDTKVDPNLALQKVQSFHERGIDLIIGPMGSGEVSNIKDYVSSNKMIIISPSSTALPTIIGFAKPEDKKYIFRFVGTDDLQSTAIAGEISSLGIKGVVITYIGNPWGKGLYEEIKPKLEKEGVEIAKVVEYPDQTPADFSPYISSLEDGVRSLVEKYGNDKVAVIAFSYEEVYTMLAQTDINSILFKVLWFGCDGTAKSGRISDVIDKVKTIGMYSTLFESKGPAYDSLKEKYIAKGYGEPYQYAMNAYDAAWVIALAYSELIEEKGSYDPDMMVTEIREVTERYSNGVYGVQPVSGKITLNEWNDRASGDYAIYYVSEEGKWDLAGLWRFETGEVEWIHKPVPPQIVTPTATPTPTAPTETPAKPTPGFEILALIAGIGIAFALRRT